MDSMTKTNLIFTLKIVGLAYVFVIISYLGMFLGWNPEFTKTVGIAGTVAFIVMVIADYVNAIQKIVGGHPVRFTLLTSLNTFKEVDTSITEFKLIDRMTEEIKEIRINEEETDKVPVGRYVYEVTFISPIELDINDKEVKARKAIIVCNAPFKYVFAPYSRVELMTLRNIVRVPASRITAEVIDYEEDEPKPVLLVVDSAFHSLMRRMKLEMPEFSKKDVLEAVKKAHMQNVLTLKGEIETKDAVIQSQLKLMKTVDKEAKKLALKFYELQREKLAPVVVNKKDVIKKAGIAAAAIVFIILLLIRFGVIA